MLLRELGSIEAGLVEVFEVVVDRDGMTDEGDDSLVGEFLVRLIGMDGGDDLLGAVGDELGDLGGLVAHIAINLVDLPLHPGVAPESVGRALDLVVALSPGACAEQGRAIPSRVKRHMDAVGLLFIGAPEDARPPPSSIKGAVESPIGCH